jgi:hypothetical protein
MRGRGLFQGLRWPVGPKLVFDHMAAKVPEIMDGSLQRAVLMDEGIMATDLCRTDSHRIPILYCSILLHCIVQ